MRRSLKEVVVSGWFDHIDRGNYEAQYLNVGARPSFARAAGISPLRNDLSKTLFLFKGKAEEPKDKEADLLAFMIQKMLRNAEY